MAELPYLAAAVVALTVVAAEEEVAPYIDLLDRALEDRQVTAEEAEALQTTAQRWGLTRGPGSVSAPRLPRIAGHGRPRRWTRDLRGAPGSGGRRAPAGDRLVRARSDSLPSGRKHTLGIHQTVSLRRPRIAPMTLG